MDAREGAPVRKRTPGLRLVETEATSRQLRTFSSWAGRMFIGRSATLGEGIGVMSGGVKEVVKGRSGRRSRRRFIVACVMALCQVLGCREQIFFSVMGVELGCGVRAGGEGGGGVGWMR